MYNMPTVMLVEDELVDTAVQAGVEEAGPLTAAEKYRAALVYTREYNERVMTYLDAVLGKPVERTTQGKVILEPFQSRRLLILALRGMIAEQAEG